MTPAELQAMIDGKVKIRDQNLRNLDRLTAMQTARLMYVQGRVVEESIDPATCMAFQWDKQKQPVTEMTDDEMIAQFDRNMQSWARATEAKHRG